MKTPFQSWLTWPNSLVPFPCWKSPKGIRRRLGERTDNRANCTAGAATLTTGSLTQRPQASGPKVPRSQGAVEGRTLRPVPAAHTPSSPRRASCASRRDTLHLKKAAFERLQGAVRLRPGQPYSWAASSSRRALSGAATLRTEPAQGRWTAGGLRASHVRPRVPRDLGQSRAGRPRWGRGHFTRVTGWFGSTWQTPWPRQPCGPRGLGVSAGGWGSAVKLLAGVGGDQINRLGCRGKTELLGPDCLSMKPGSWLTRWSKLPYHSRFGLHFLSSLKWGY